MLYLRKDTLEVFESLPEYIYASPTIKVRVTPENSKWQFYDLDYSTLRALKSKIVGRYNEDKYLEIASKIKRHEIDKIRKLQNQGIFCFRDKEFSMNNESRQSIALMSEVIKFSNKLPDSLSEGWKAIDGTYLKIINVAMWAQLITAMQMAEATNFKRSERRKKEVQKIISYSEEDLSVDEKVRHIEKVSW